MEFDLQAIWTTAGAATTILIIGYIWGFLQSIVPFIPTTGTVRNIVLTSITAGLVVLAGVASGKTLEDPAVVTNVLSGFIVFLGLQRMAIASADAGNLTAQRTAGGEALETMPPAASVPTEGTGDEEDPPF